MGTDRGAGLRRDVERRPAIRVLSRHQKGARQSTSGVGMRETGIGPIPRLLLPRREARRPLLNRYHPHLRIRSQAENSFC